MQAFLQFPVRKLLVAMTAATFLLVSLPTTADARSPRGFVKYNLGKIQKKIEKGRDGIKQALDAGAQLEDGKDDIASANKNYSDLQAQLKQSSKDLQLLISRQNTMAKNISAMPSRTPGRASLLRDIKDAQKRTKQMSKSLNKAKFLAAKFKPLFKDIVDLLKDATVTFEDNKGLLQKARNALGTAKDMVKSMKSTAKYLPNAPNIPQLK
jgi:septal ring factor EnvC (AmiA/AmiB activator)